MFTPLDLFAAVGRAYNAALGCATALDLAAQVANPAAVVPTGPSKAVRHAAEYLAVFVTPPTEIAEPA